MTLDHDRMDSGILARTTPRMRLLPDERVQALLTAINFRMRHESCQCAQSANPGFYVLTLTGEQRTLLV